MTRMKSGIIFMAAVFIHINVLAYAQIKTSSESIAPGTEITVKGDPMKLYSGGLSVGDNFLDVIKETDIDFDFKNKVTIISIVPSLDTPVCEAQTHDIGESKDIDPEIDLVTISRDLPTAQKRFAREANLDNITYYSDYKTASFGKQTGLLIRGKELLARGILVLDQKGVIQYLQIVPELTELPDVDKAIEFANTLVNDKSSPDS